MSRLTAFTAIGLCLVSLTFNLAFADRTDVKWREMSLKTEEITIQIENCGVRAWDGLTLAVCIYGKNDKLVAKALLNLKKPIPADERQSYKLAFDRPITQGKNYRILAFLQQGKSKVVSQTWDDVPVFELMPTRKTQNAKGFGVIPEVGQMKKDTGLTDIRSAMGVL